MPHPVYQQCESIGLLINQAMEELRCQNVEACLKVLQDALQRNKALSKALIKPTSFNPSQSWADTFCIAFIALFTLSSLFLAFFGNGNPLTRFVVIAALCGALLCWIWRKGV